MIQRGLRRIAAIRRGRSISGRSRTLIEAGADVNAENSDGDTALKMAQRRDHTEIAQLLKDAGAME